MMEMDGRNGAKCQKSKLGDIDDIIEFVLNDNKTKLCIVSSPTIEIRSQKCERTRIDAVADFFMFSERVSRFSLDLQAIRPSEFVGTRRKVALRSEAYAWASILRSFNKLCEVGDLSYLVYF